VKPVRSDSASESPTCETLAAHHTECGIIERHRALWRKKPVLTHIYSAWFERLLADIPRGVRVLEVGAGPGFFSQYARRVRPDLRWLASDYLVVPGNDFVADALQLPIRDASVDAVLGCDILHHLVRPAHFFSEASRVLRPQGALVLLEPWLTHFSYPIYRFVHHEECRSPADPWRPFDAEESWGKLPFEGNSAVPWSMVRRVPAESWAPLGFHPPQVDLCNGFAYLFSLGFRDANLLPGLAATRALLSFDRWSQPAARWLALRARLRWLKSPVAEPGDAAVSTRAPATA
jgi:SAM-dependent methyltransferase